MKNNFYFIKILLIFFYCFLQFNYIFAKDLNFKASEILTYEEGNLVIGNKNAEAKIDGELEIYADKFTYNRNKETLIAEGNVKALDIINKINIQSNKIFYDKIQNKIISFDKTNFVINEIYKINSEDVNFLLNKNIIFSNKKTKLIDNENNNIQLASFRYFNQTEIIKGNEIKLLDKEGNNYFVDEGMLKLKEYEMLGKDIQVYLRKDSFGNPENEPKLKGKFSSL